MSGSVFQAQTTECVAYKWMCLELSLGGTCYKAMGTRYRGYYILLGNVGCQWATVHNTLLLSD